MNNITENCSNCLHSCETDNLYCSKHNKQVFDSEICFEYSHEKQCSETTEILHKQGRSVYGH